MSNFSDEFVANTSSSNISSASSPKVELWYQAIVYSLTIPLFVLTTAGNGVILLTIKFQARLLSSTSNYFILSLAFADFFVGVVIMPIMIVYTANKQAWTFSLLSLFLLATAVCDSWMAIDFLCSSASFLTLSMMSIERYKMLTNSYAHIKHSSRLRILVFIGLSWLVPLVSWLPTIVLSRSLSPAGSSANECFLPAPRTLILVICFFVYHIPLVCMVTFYTKLIIYIKQSSSTNLEALDSAATSPKSGVAHQSLTNFYERESNSIVVGNSQLAMHRHLSLQPTRTKFLANSTVFSAQNSNRNKSTCSSETLAKLKSLVPCCFFKPSNKSLIKKRALTPSPASKRQQSLVDQKVLSRSKKALNFAELCSNVSRKSFNRDGSLIRENQSVRGFKNELRFASFNPVNDCNSLIDQCHFTIHSRSLNNHPESLEVNENSRMNNKGAAAAAAASSFYQKEFSSDCTSHENLKRCSVAATKKKDSSAQSKIYDSSSYQNLRLKRNQKAARMLGILVAAFSFCWLPFIVLYPFSQFYPNFLPGYVNAIIWWMGYLNSTINPFLYVYSNKNIRRSVRILFCQRLWGFCTGGHVNKSFRSDSLKQNMGIYPNGILGANIYRRNSHKHINFNIPL